MGGAGYAGTVGDWQGACSAMPSGSVSASAAPKFFRDLVRAGRNRCGKRRAGIVHRLLRAGTAREPHKDGRLSHADLRSARRSRERRSGLLQERVARRAYFRPLGWPSSGALCHARRYRCRRPRARARAALCGRPHRGVLPAYPGFGARPVAGRLLPATCLRGRERTRLHAHRAHIDRARRARPAKRIVAIDPGVAARASRCGARRDGKRRIFRIRPGSTFGRPLAGKSRKRRRGAYAGSKSGCRFTPACVGRAVFRCGHIARSGCRKTQSVARSPADRAGYGRRDQRPHTRRCVLGFRSLRRSRRGPHEVSGSTFRFAAEDASQLLLLRTKTIPEHRNDAQGPPAERRRARAVRRNVQGRQSTGEAKACCAESADTQTRAGFATCSPPATTAQNASLRLRVWTATRPSVSAADSSIPRRASICMG